MNIKGTFEGNDIEVGPSLRKIKYMSGLRKPPRIQIKWPQEQQMAFRRIGEILDQFSPEVKVEIVDFLHEIMHRPVMQHEGPKRNIPPSQE